MSLLIGVACGLAIAVVAAAERTETVMDRYFEASRARDLLVAPRPAVQHGHGGGGQRSRSLGPRLRADVPRGNGYSVSF